MENVSYLCIVTCEVTIHRQLDAQISRRMLAPYTERLGFLLIPMDEIWKPVLGYEGLYEVSNHERVRSISRMVINSNGVGERRSPGKLLKQYMGDVGYYCVTLCKDGVPKKKRVHDLVCSAFHGPRPEGMEVLHLDGTRTNNMPENLMWGTRSDNMRDPICKAKRIAASKALWANGRMEFKKKSVEQYDTRGNLIAEFESASAASRETGLMRESISRACRGESKSAGGYTWKFKNN